MHNTLQCRPDFRDQKCKLEEVCDSAGIKFHLLPICHPELNPIEGAAFYNLGLHIIFNLYHHPPNAIDFWNCTKRYTREKCDYTLRGLRKTLPAAFMSVTMYWIRKAFERADRFLALYDMETQAIPFQLRDFMVRCWKRHRDVPTKISELVDRAVDDLQRRQLDLKHRMSKNILKVEPLDKVTDLLDCCFLVGDCLPANGDADTVRLKQKLKDIQEKQAKEDIHLQKIQSRFIELRKKGKLGVVARPILQPASSAVLNLVDEVEGNYPSTVQETCNNAIIECAELPEGAEDSQLTEGHEEWVECVLCSKWRRLPPGVVGDTLSLTQWQCSDGNVWRIDLNCDVPADVWEEVRYLPT
jgi:hypothetical protein